MPSSELTEKGGATSTMQINMTTVLLLSVSTSVLASMAVTYAVDRQRESVPPDVVRAKRIELVDSRGQVESWYGVVDEGGRSVPRLVMRGSDGHESLALQVDMRGDGDLSFGNDHWQTSAIILGHLVNVDDGTESKSRDVEDTTGSWGLQVRSKDDKFTRVGFLNSGKPMVPITQVPAS